MIEAGIARRRSCSSHAGWEKGRSTCTHAVRVSTKQIYGRRYVPIQRFEKDTTAATNVTRATSSRARIVFVSFAPPERMWNGGSLVSLFTSDEH